MINRPVRGFGRIGVLMGGVSSEREISLKSGNAVFQALLSQGCDVVALDVVDEREAAILSLLQNSGVELAFIALHGRFGEDGTIQSILEGAGISYTGSGVSASRLAINKALTQKLLKENLIPVPPSIPVSQGHRWDVLETAATIGGFPIVIKPACEGSSIGIHVCRNAEEVSDAMRDAARYGDTVLVEKYIHGKELTVGILGEKALPVIEIRPKCSFFDFEAKYTKGMTDYIVPAQIPSATALALQNIAWKAHKTLGCADISRVDFILASDGVGYVLEVNTIPGFTATSLLPKAAGHLGISFDQLCLRLVEMAYGKKRQPGYTALYN